MVGIVNVVGNFGVAIVCAEILSGVSAVLFARDEGVLSTSGAARAVGVDKSRITGEGVVMMLSCRGAKGRPSTPLSRSYLNRDTPPQIVEIA
jgi:hypothetical protein